MRMSGLDCLEHVNMNSCLVKYIDIGSIQGDDPDFNIEQFVKGKHQIWHSTYTEMHQGVFETPGPPYAYRCVEPLALHHSVLWSNGVVNVDGVYTRCTLGRDQLHHAIEAQEYDLLWRGDSGKKPLPIYVDVERIEVDTRVGIL